MWGGWTFVLSSVPSRTVSDCLPWTAHEAPFIHCWLNGTWLPLHLRLVIFNGQTVSSESFLGPAFIHLFIYSASAKRHGRTQREHKPSSYFAFL